MTSFARCTHPFTCTNTFTQPERIYISLVCMQLRDFNRKITWSCSNKMRILMTVHEIPSYSSFYHKETQERRELIRDDHKSDKKLKKCNFDLNKKLISPVKFLLIILKKKIFNTPTVTLHRYRYFPFNNAISKIKRIYYAL